ncbi:hypothetical protein QVD99_001651 [Batrachochytrium dendrobatidis]|nr:hypothetical protein O5D80_000301 [Batrachochytrium dendrobatidis]KAK5671819.1 hypothetical protein QVD99_001651 [Batrachochytrium dendrobatidis]
MTSIGQDIAPILDKVLSVLSLVESKLEQLFSLHRMLCLTIPYENLSVYYGTQPPTMDVRAICKKLSSGIRGGYCLELNTFYALLLQRLGFGVEKRSAKVILGMTEECDRANRDDSHIVLIVSLPQGVAADGESGWTGKWLCDIGAADFAPMEPMPFRDYTAEIPATPGSGGKTFKLVQGSWLNKQGWFFTYHDKAKQTDSDLVESASQSTPVYDRFFFFEDVDCDDEHFNAMNDQVKQPEKCPPFPFNTEYATFSKPDGSRMTVIGTKKDGYTFYERSHLGKTLRSEKLIGEEELKQILLLHFSIVFPI